MPAAKAKATAQIHAVLGSDESEVKRAARDLATQLVPEGGGEFAQEIIDGCVGNADEAVQRIHQTIEALLTYSFFGGEKLVWLKNANFLADTQTGKAASTLEALEKLAETLANGFPESTRFLLSAIEPDKRRTFYKTLTKAAKVEIHDKLDPNKSGWEEEAALMVRAAADARGLKFTSEALDLFTLYTGGERGAIDNELEKLDLYLGTGVRQIDDELVRLLVPLSRVGIIWELGNALSERNPHRALRLMEQLLFQGEKAIGILIVVVIPTIRNLLVVKDLMQRHKLTRPAQPFFFGKTLERLSPAATAHLPRKKDGGINAFALGLAAQHAHRFQTAELRKMLEDCLNANVQLVSSAMEAKVVLSHLIIRIVGER